MYLRDLDVNTDFLLIVLFYSAINTIVFWAYMRAFKFKKAWYFKNKTLVFTFPFNITILIGGTAMNFICYFVCIIVCLHAVQYIKKIILLYSEMCGMSYAIVGFIYELVALTLGLSFEVGCTLSPHLIQTRFKISF